MTRLCTTLAICLAAMVMVSDRADASDQSAMTGSTEVKTAFFQPRPGGVVDVLTSPFRALTGNTSYRGRQQAYAPYYGQSNYRSPSGTTCVNGRCYTGSSYGSSCVNGYCPTGSCATGNCATGACTTGNCGTGYQYGNCPGGNCGTTRYQTLPFQTYTGYRGVNQGNIPQYSTYRPVSQPVYRPAVPSRTNSIRNDPFFP
ncbi:hypothetical protein Pan241w_34710 [Gimesia alba]|uniref:Stigma-specific protein, Stig1 n=1 Tax=Gimesia alba TaxID=2527973 RepID=A0A517RHK9_9PLAN|nr:hypothetical protein [Gimesia alba]QDT43371.1 hypothetical protein Pan241w_34710 [Gimesia alba]